MFGLIVLALRAKNEKNIDVAFSIFDQALASKYSS